MKNRKTLSIVILCLVSLGCLPIAQIVIAADEQTGAGFSSIFNVWGGCRSGQQTSDGGYIAVGYSTYYDYNAGGKNIFLIKIDANGGEQWHQTYGSGTAWDVQQTTDGGYIMATEGSLIKTDINGSEQWRKTIPGSYLNIRSLRLTNDGGYIITGLISSYEHNLGISLIKTDTSGNEQWNKTFGGKKIQDVGSVQKTTDEGFIICGSTSDGAWLIKTDINGNEQWNKTFDLFSTGYSAQQTTDEGYIVAGSFTSSYGGDVNVWLIKTDANGNEQWNKTFGGTKSDYGKGVQETRDGGFIIVGNTYSFDTDSYSSIWVIKTDSAGDMKWNNTFSRLVATGWSVQQTSDGGYFITGSTNQGNIPTDSEFWLIKIAPDVHLTPMENDTYWLAKAIMSEASIGSTEEQIAVGWCVLNRLHDGSFGDTMEGVVKNGFAWNQEPTQEIKSIARALIEVEMPDPTNGAIYFFSPRSMPKDGENTQGYDVGGGLHIVPGTLYKVYFPSWAEPTIEINQNTTSYKTSDQLEWNELSGIRNWYFMFYHPISSQNEPLENNNLNDDTSSGTKIKTPGFEIILVVCAIALVMFWKRKKEKQ
jgi:hypothetical protein